MARYINADELYKATQKRIAEANEARMAVVDDEFLDLINDAFTEDVAPRAEWISVDERLPDIEPHGKGRYGGARSVRVLCACKQRDGRTFVKEGYYEPCGNGNVVWRIPGSIDSVTHWMPLPEPPKGE